MIPEIDRSLLPSAPLGGKEAIRYLESIGLVAQSPPVRSSDYRLALSDPFRYYLSRRLGLVPRLFYSKALVHGSWFHKRLEALSLSPSEAGTFMSKALFDRADELKEIGASAGLSATKLTTLIDDELRSAKESHAWYEAMSTVPIPGRDGSFVDFLTRPYWRILGHEIPLCILHGVGGTDPIPCDGRADIILYHTKQNVLWIVDAKTCSGSPTDRLQSTPIEFQTAHYCFVLDKLLRSTDFAGIFRLPRDVKVAGMIHIAFQKPTITFGQNDRNFTVKTFTPSRGPNKGVPREVKEYHGEPDFDNYLERVTHWCKGTGPYVHLQGEREADPVVNMSFTKFDTIDNSMDRNYYESQLNMVHELSRRNPAPENFLKAEDGMHTYGGKLNPYASFYVAPVQDWPAVILEKDFIIRHRDEEYGLEDGNT